MTIKEIIKDMLDACNKYNLESVPVMKSELEQVLKDLEQKEKQYKILETLKSQIDIKAGLDTLSKKPIYIIETKRFAFPLSEEKGHLIKEWLDE